MSQSQTLLGVDSGLCQSLNFQSLHGSLCLPPHYVDQLRSHWQNTHLQFRQFFLSPSESTPSKQLTSTDKGLTLLESSGVLTFFFTTGKIQLQIVGITAPPVELFNGLWRT